VPADLDDLLRRADPARSGHLPALPATLVDEIVAGRRHRTLPLRMPLAWSGGLAAVLALAVAAAVLLAPPEHVAPPRLVPAVLPSDPVGFMHGLAVTAAAQRRPRDYASTWQAWYPARPEGAGPLLGVELTSVDAKERGDGSIEWNHERGRYEFYDKRAEAAWVAAGRPPMASGMLVHPDLPGPRTDRMAMWLDPVEMVLGGTDGPPEARRPYDVAGLRRALQVRREDGSGWVLPWERVVACLSPGSPPGLRATAYKLLSEMDGVTVDPQAVDLRGRPGAAFQLDDGGLRHRFVVDRGSSQVLSYEQTLLREVPWAMAAPGTRIGAIALLSARGRR